MNFLFEDVFNLANFTSCKDINKSGIPRFAISPLFTSTQIYVNANNKHDELGIFPATDEIDEYVIASCVNHSPDDWTGHDPRVKSFFYYLNDKYIRDLRANKAFLMLDQSLEGYQTPWLWDWFHKECQAWDISPTRIIYVTGNMIADTVYEKWCDDNNVNIRMKVIPYPHFELDMGMTTWGRNKENSIKKLPSFEDNLKYKIENLNDLKTYACLNKRIRPHRVWFYYYLYYSGLLDKGLVSMNEFDKHTYEWEGKHFEHGMLDECSSILPLLVYDTPNNVLDDNIYINRFPEKVVKDTFFTVVSEAHCGDSDETMFLSEKTFKVIGCRHPFTIMGNKDSMAMMRKIGYKTFDGFIDEGYDTLPTHERLQYIIESIRKVDKIDNKIEWYKSLEEIIEFNYGVLIDKLFRYPDAYMDMKNYCNMETINKIKLI
jgi:hypothetical protein